ncbi:MAG: RDD family protein [Acidobacteriota bacterium]
MKCPKCGYLGFETGDRCRNCGYDFSLSARPSTASDLPLYDREAGGPLADFALDGGAAPSSPIGTVSGLEIDRPANAPSPVASRPPARDAGASPIAAPRDVPDTEPSTDAEPPLNGLLFPPGVPPIVTPPRPARPPLAVRRAAPEVPRTRSRTTRPYREPELELSLEAEPEAAPASVEPPPRADLSAAAAPRGARLLAAALDGLLLVGIDAGVVYLTLRMAQLSVAEIGVLPVIPLAVFLALLDGGYLVAFTAGGGQTIGKMATGIQVIGADGRAVDLTGAILRVCASALALLTLGVTYLPAVASADGRALHDRLAGTRVVRA